MITKDIAEWLERYTDKHGLPKAARCAKCLGVAKLRVESDGISGTGRLICGNPDCGNGSWANTEEDCEKLIAVVTEEWNKMNRDIVRTAAKKAAKKNEVAA